MFTRKTYLVIQLNYEINYKALDMLNEAYQKMDSALKRFLKDPNNVFRDRKEKLSETYYIIAQSKYIDHDNIAYSLIEKFIESHENFNNVYNLVSYSIEIMGRIEFTMTSKDKNITILKEEK